MTVGSRTGSSAAHGSTGGSGSVSSGSSQPVVAAVERHLHGLDVGQRPAHGAVGGAQPPAQVGRRCRARTCASQRRTSSAYPSRGPRAARAAPPATAPSASTAGGRSASGRRCGRAPARASTASWVSTRGASATLAPYALPTARSIRSASSGSSSRRVRRVELGAVGEAGQHRGLGGLEPGRAVRRRRRRSRPPWPGGRRCVRRHPGRGAPPGGRQEIAREDEERAAHRELLDQRAVVVQRPVDVGDREAVARGPAARGRRCAGSVACSTVIARVAATGSTSRWAGASACRRASRARRSSSPTCRMRAILPDPARLPGRPVPRAHLASPGDAPAGRAPC